MNLNTIPPLERQPLLASATSFGAQPGAWGHIESLEGCTWHYGRGEPHGNELTISTPAGYKIGFNIGDLLQASLHLKEFAAVVARLKKQNEIAGDSMPADYAISTLNALVDKARELVNVN